MTDTQELSLWQSIASLNCVEGLRIEVGPFPPFCEFMRVWRVDGYYELSNDTPASHHRTVGLHIVDAIEASTRWRFTRHLGGYWGAKNNFEPEFWDFSSAEIGGEHLSLLTVIERVMRAIKEGK